MAQKLNMSLRKSLWSGWVSHIPQQIPRHQYMGAKKQKTNTVKIVFFMCKCINNMVFVTEDKHFSLDSLSMFYKTLKDNVKMWGWFSSHTGVKQLLLYLYNKQLQPWATQAARSVREPCCVTAVLPPLLVRPLKCPVKCQAEVLRHFEPWHKTYLLHHNHPLPQTRWLAENSEPLGVNLIN